MLSWAVSKLRLGSCCTVLPVSAKNGHKEQHLTNCLEWTTQMVPKLLLLTAFFTLVLLLLHSGFNSNQTPEARQNRVGPTTAFRVPQGLSTKPTKGPVQPLVKGMKCGEVQHRFPDSMPPIVHWTTKDGRVHKKLINIVQSWQLLNKNSSIKWYYMHWDDYQISRLVEKHYPQLRKSYAKLSNGLERSDIGRLVVLHHVGGMYVDLDVELRRDLSPLLMPNSESRGDNSTAASSSVGNCRTALWSQEPPEHAAFIFNRPSLISNAVMMSRANHSFLNYVVNTWPAWFEANWAKKRRGIHQAIHVTGPGMLQNFYDKYAAMRKAERPDDWCNEMIAEPEMFQPIMDENFIRSWLRTNCGNSARMARLSELKQEHCRQIKCANFKNRAVPSTSYTVHRFMHLSYGAMKLDDSECILRMLPVLTCTI
ncbi:hypothetical protein BOX15_Mlig014093g3 [Macrostomum lignano]|uniref:Uncharacterized protein n=1 Tax=Macrostomum lignano TaxID=282301 RepID=A0A267FYX1_9PLAT|nr:hypothetical protein BOX15_Mlig014093g3 [Macrostomum lignano]